MDALDTQRQLLDLSVRLERLEKTEIPGVMGDWTPAFVGTGTAGTFTYSVQIGRYLRTNKVIIAMARVRISAISVAPTTNMTITGLPIAAKNTTNYFGNVHFGLVSNFNYTAAALDLNGIIRPATSVIEMYESFDNIATVQVPAANFTNANCDLSLVAIYEID